MDEYFKFDIQLFADGDAPPVGDAGGDVTPPVSSPAGGEETGQPEGGNPTGEQVTEPPAPTGAPEQYADYTLPDGLTYDANSAQEFNVLAKELNLTQEQAQKMVDLYAGRMLDMTKQQQAQSESWYKESKQMYSTADLDVANKTLMRFADKDVIELLGSTGLANHPKVIGLFKSIGDQISEAQFVDGGSGSQKTAAEILYPSMKK